MENPVMTFPTVQNIKEATKMLLNQEMMSQKDIRREAQRSSIPVRSVEKDFH